MAEAKPEADQPPVSKTSKVMGRIKAFVASFAGLLTGAAVMYASPILNQVIKPAAPLANFQAEAVNLKVTFHNRSSGGTQGWWDFGDGSALEAFVPNQDVVHTFPRPGAFAVKLSIKNLIGDGNDRSISLVLDAERPPPSIDEFTVTPLQANTYAPATFHLTARHKNADVCVWFLGDEQPLEIEEEATAVQERMVTFKQAGTYTVKFAVFNGKQTIERKEQIVVSPQPAGVTTALVQVIYEASRIKPREQSLAVPIHFPTNVSGNTFAFAYEFQAEHGFAYTKAVLGQAPPGAAKDVKVTLSADKQKVQFTGALVKPGGLLHRNAPLPQWTAPLILEQEWRGEMKKRPPQQAAVTLQVPGVTELPLPALANGWVAKSRALDLELRKEGNVVWRGTQMPHNAVMSLTNGQTYSLTVTETPSGRLRIEVTPTPGMGPLGN